MLTIEQYLQQHYQGTHLGPISTDLGAAVIGAVPGNVTLSAPILQGGAEMLGDSISEKPTVTGSRGGNAALASLITALASLGLLTDSTVD